MAAFKVQACLTFLMLFSCIKSQLFTAVVDLETLLLTEGEIVRTLEKYLILEEQRLEEVRWLREEYEKIYHAASTDIQAFISNPVNAYILVKRLTADWNLLEDLIEGSDSKDVIKNITHYPDDLKFPNDKDLNGAAAALFRLQDTYQLNTAEMAQGIIEGATASTELTAGDCFELGRQAYTIADYHHATLWLQETLNRIENEDKKTADRIEAAEYGAYSAYMQGNISHASKLTNEILELEPDHPRAQLNLKYYDYARVELKFGTADENDPDTHESDTYKKLCRGEKMKTDADESELHCRYFTNDHPYLLLQPVKEEELNLKPKVVVYYDILSDKEMDVIKSLARPKLLTAGVGITNVDSSDFPSVRISKNAWLRNEEHVVVQRVNQRVEDITGLDLDTAEDLQVVNYGLGGHYNEHFDFVAEGEPNIFEHLGTGNRIATWLSYMSDVSGGATVFPFLGVSVKPRKGSAAFWYNLFRSGEGITDTRHAGCPVLSGSKWDYAINSIIYQRGIYPPESFTREQKYGISFLMSNNDQLKSFVSNVLKQFHRCMLTKEIHRLVVVISNFQTKETLERWEFRIECEGEFEANGQCKSKDIKEIQKEIRNIIRQITASVTFLPLLDTACSFDVLLYTNKDSVIPEEWAEETAHLIPDCEEVCLSNFSTSVHRVDPTVQYKMCD